MATVTIPRTVPREVGQAPHPDELDVVLTAHDDRLDSLESGSINKKVVSVAHPGGGGAFSHAMGSDDAITLANAAGGIVRCALPPIASAFSGGKSKCYYVKKTEIAPNAVEVRPNAADVGSLIDNGTFLSLGVLTGSAGSGARIATDGTNWWVLSQA